jgi:hypothetical protein
VRREALALLERTADDLSDMELFGRLTDDGWYIEICIEQLHRLPSEVDPILGCREYTTLQARSIVKQAQSNLMRRFQNQNTGM